MAGPLAGVRILDCTTVVLGPWAAQQLGDLGADVIKIEPPEGDTTRVLGRRAIPGMAAFYLGCNRSKRSIVLDLKQDSGRKALFKLAETADVLMHNYRPDPARRSASSTRSSRRSIRAGLRRGLRLSRAGPMGAKAAYDDIIQAGSGLAALQSVVAGQPRFLPTIVADKTSSNGVVSRCSPRCSRASAPARARRSKCRCSRPWSRS
jgi:crotonobetainyl-CoA:carnitine CoA-transferase CaiB-like acyl-CoA transferase